MKPNLKSVIRSPKFEAPLRAVAWIAHRQVSVRPRLWLLILLPYWLSSLGSTAAEIVISPANHFGGAMASVAVPPEGGHYVYSGEGSGLGVWDVRDKCNPVFAGSLTLDGDDVTDIQFDATGQVAYLANGAGVQVISLADPIKPLLLGRCATTSPARSVAVVNATYVLIAASTSGDSWIRAVTIADPANPADVGGYATPGLARHVCVVGDRAYVADGNAGLLVLDISQPAAPLFLGSYDTPGHAQKVLVAGTVAYVADGMGGLHLLNIANPASISLLATTRTNGNVTEVQVAGTTAYTLDQATGDCHVLDVATPAAPVQIATFALDWDAWRVAVSGHYAYLACMANGLAIVNVTTPSNPTLAGSYERPSYPMNGRIVGATGYILDQWQLWVCSYTNPAAPAVLGKCDLGHITNPWLGEPEPRIAVAGNLAVVAKGNYGMVIVNINDPRAPTIVGHFAVPAGNMATDVALDGTLAGLLTVSNHLGRLRLINLADPSNPAELGGLDTPGDARRLTMANHIAYVADGAGGARFINLTTPSAPVEIGHIDPPADAVADDIAVENHPSTGRPCALIVFNAGTGWQVQAYEVLNPASPVLLNEKKSATGHINDLEVAGSRAYLAGSLGVLDWDEITMVEVEMLARGAILQASIQSVQVFKFDTRTYYLVFWKGASGGWSLYVEENTSQLSRLEVLPGDVIVRVGEQQQFSAAGYDTNANPVTATVEWTTTGGNITQDGNFTADTIGDFQVIATEAATGISSTVTVHCVMGVQIGTLQSQQGVQLSWPSRPGKVYDVYQSTTLLPGGWVKLANGLPATPPQNTWNDTSSMSLCEQGFYRVVERTP